MKEEFCHWGTCIKCHKQKDLNDSLTCSDCKNIRMSKPVKVIDEATGRVLFDGDNIYKLEEAIINANIIGRKTYISI